MGKSLPRQISRLHHAAFAEIQMKSLSSEGDAHPSFADVYFYAGKKRELSMEANGHIVLLSQDLPFFTVSQYMYW